MTPDYDLIIIGGGAIGLSSAWHAARLGKKTLVLERYTFGNQEGSSAGASRQFRVQYSEEYMADLAEQAIPWWQQLERESGTNVVGDQGSLWFTEPGSSGTQEGGVDSAMDTMDALDIPYIPLDAFEIEDQYGFTNLPADYYGFFQSQGGMINVPATLKALYDLADKSKHVTLKDKTEVTNLVARPDTVTVFSKNQSWTASKLIVTAGAYTNDVLKPLNVQLNVIIWEMVSAYFKKKNPDVDFPTWFAFQQPENPDQKINDTLFYGFPEASWAHPGYIRVAPDFPMKILTDPSQRVGTPSPHDLRLTAHWVRTHMKGLSPKPEFTSTCLISLVGDGSEELLLDFAPDYVPGNQNVVIYCAGWAFKFVPLLGRIMTDLAFTGSTSYDVSHFAIDRPGILRTPFTTQRPVITNSDLTLKKGYKNGLDMDVAIVGAGAGGIYSGYRLLTGEYQKGQKPAKDINVFEMSGRVGGRLESVVLPGMDFAGELGGMRYMTTQEIVTGLIENVFAGKLTSMPFPMGQAEHHLFYLRRQRFLADAWQKAQAQGEKFITRYFLKPENVGKSADDLFNQIVEDVLLTNGYSLSQIQNSPNPRREWNRVKKKLRYLYNGPYADRMLYEIGFWNLIKDQTSQEAYTFMADAGGYFSNTINWNAAEAFPYMVGDFADAEVEYKTISGGYDQWILCMADEFTRQGGTIWAENALANFSKNSKGGYDLVLYNKTADKYWKAHARHLVLAMPRRSLELLPQDNFFFASSQQQTLRDNIDSVIIEPSYKILLGFEYPWWIQSRLGAHHGESITDLPMRQCYYFGVDPHNGHSLFLASYNDMRTTTFWHPLEEPAAKRWQYRDTRHTTLKMLKNFPYEQAPEAMVYEALKQVRELHGPEIRVPEPYTTAYRDWSHDPYGGGYHAWKANYKVWDVMPYMRKPVKDENIYIIGSAYSDQQGWAEGALCVAENMLEDYFGLKRPGWLSANYYLGW